MVAPLRGSIPGRPARLQVADPGLAEHLGFLARSLGIEVRVTERLEALDATASSLMGLMAQSGPVVLPTSQRDLYTAAAAYARMRPWELFSTEPVFAIGSDVPGWGDVRAVVMGGLGETFGLAVYRDQAGLDAVRARHLRRIGPSPLCVAEAVSVVLCRADELAPSLVRSAKRLGLPVERGRHPLFSHLFPGREPVDLHSPEQARVLFQALRAVTAWVERCDRSDPDDEAAPLTMEDGVTCRLLNPIEALRSFFDDDPEGAESIELCMLTDEPMTLQLGYADVARVAARGGVPTPDVDVTHVPMMVFRTTAQGLTDTGAAVEQCEAIDILPDLAGGCFLALVDADEQPTALLARIEQTPAGLEVWLAAVNAAGSWVLLGVDDRPDQGPEGLPKAVGLVPFHGADELRSL
jgi:hypothetical protein